MKKLLMLILVLASRTSAAQNMPGQTPPEVEEPKVKETVPESPEKEISFSIPMPKFNLLLQNWAFYDSTNTAKSNFRIRRAEFKASGNIIPDLRYFVMIDPAKSLSTGPILNTNDNKILQDIGIAYQLIKGLEFSIGQFKAPTTAEGLMSSSELPLPERSLTGRTFGDKRETGAMITYKHDLFKISVMGSNGGSPNTNDTNTRKDLHGRLDLTLVENLTLGTFSTYIDSTDQKGHRHGANLGAQLANFFLTAEGGIGKGSGITTSGFYVDFGYDYKKKFKPLLRYEYFNVGTLSSNFYTAGFGYGIVPTKAIIQLAYTYMDNAVTNLGTPRQLRDENGSLIVANFQVAL